MIVTTTTGGVRYGLAKSNRYSPLESLLALTPFALALPFGETRPERIVASAPALSIGSLLSNPNGLQVIDRPVKNEMTSNTAKINTATPKNHLGRFLTSMPETLSVGPASLSGGVAAPVFSVLLFWASIVHLRMGNATACIRY